MQLSKSSFVLGNIAGSVVVGLIAVACGGGSDGFVFIPPPSSSGAGGTLKASNVIVRAGAQTASSKAGIVRVQANQLPENVQVQASNVSLVTVANDLQSTDLQSALDKEIAVDLQKAIVGVWNVENFSSDSTYAGEFASGRVEFRTNGSYVILSGGFAAAGKVAPGTTSFCIVPNAMSFSLVDGAIYFQADSGGNSVATVAKSTTSAITLIGDGGCGQQGTSRISRLTRLGTQPTSAVRQPLKSVKQMVAMTTTN
ncbi:hypothetical protein QTH90_02520 [Variovorax sp. J2P1-59]|uniref:hypothetical protein n=1 Tax=Variovorax flavidus TaxID=3053501 RepID=UPI002574D8AF|nr:hypothetical protein [Variovorax sp. J2P1-59]MDM0073238.1 hypothetical protein [Variovorax sp. J2P1-59]